jgi:RNA polymerase sigma-70 factor (ECF subfamily)
MQPRFGTREWQLAYVVALRILKAPDQAEDAAQETMLRAYRARQTYSGEARFESWLYRIAFTTALSFLRKPHFRRYQPPAPGSDWRSQLAELEAPGQTPEETANANQLAESLQGCLCDMREDDRVAFTERYLNGTSERELGEILGVSTNAAKQRAFRARREIRRCIQARQSAPAPLESTGQ